MEKDNVTRPAAEKHASKAFVNWTFVNPNDEKQFVRSSKGFPLQGHPDYPNKQEDFLIKLAEKHLEKNPSATSLDVTLKCRIHLNTNSVDLDVNDFLADTGLENEFAEEQEPVI